VLWSYSLKEYKRSFNVLLARISALVKQSGWTFTFNYLKEVVRVLVRLLAGNEVVKSTKVFVKTDKQGFPVIIPKDLRDVILLNEVRPHIRKKMIGALLTILSLYRVFPTKVNPSTSTITEPFNGLSKSLDSDLLIKSLKELGLYKSYKKNNRCRLYWSEAAGPNSAIAGFGSINDALALLHTPSILWHVLVSLMKRGNIGLLTYILLIITLFGPLYLLITWWGLKPFVNGRLSVVYDQAGKARVIAITSYWIQTVLRPLHDFLFSSLRNIGEDSTFDQDRKFSELLSSLSREKPKLYGFDLSAATDRLPIVLQQDILSLIGFNLPWSSILDLDWHLNFRVDSNVNSVRYAVGQPMGALSSWAMLAVTHHVIVKVAAIKAGLQNFRDYCILGDDIVIANDKVSQEYLTLMATLGLEINRQKSVESNRFTEFAKKLKGFEGIDYTPIGPGLLVQTIRSRAYSIRFTMEVVNKGLFHLDSIKETFSKAPKWFRSRTRLLLWSAVLGAYITSDSKGRSLDVTSVTMESRPLVRYMVSNINRFYYPLVLEVQAEYLRLWNRYRSELKFFLREILFINLTRKTYHSVPAFLNFLNLGFWVLIVRYFKNLISLIEFHCKIYVILWKHHNIYAEKEFLAKQEIAPLMELLDLTSIASIDWGEKTKVLDRTRVMASLCRKADRGSMIRGMLKRKW